VGGVSLDAEVSGSGAPVVLLHGLSATRRYVVMGSTALQRSGRRVIAYDARGHGRSGAAAGPEEYSYANLTGDLLAVLDSLEIGRALIAGVSMGAHTAVRLALQHPARVSALGIITPAYEPAAPWGDGVRPEAWAALASGLRSGGVDGFIAAYDFSDIPASWRSTVERGIRQRLAEHIHPEAVADALEGTPRTRPFERMEELASLSIPSLVVASRDEADPGHPLAVGERYAQAIPGARLLVEDPPPPLRSPIAWQGGRLSKALIELSAAARP
jgi:pimeloyl-ACP methyl ester carboxylesterase